MLRSNKITETWLADAFSQRLRIPIVGLTTMSVDPEAAHRIPENLARKHQCIPFSINGRTLRVAFVDPSNLASLQAIEFFTGCKIQPVVGTRGQILEAIDEQYARSQAVDIIDQATDQAEVQIVSPIGEDIDLDEAASLKAAEIPPIIKLVNMVMAEALRVRASDIHIEPNEHDIRIRLRVDGVLRDFLQAPIWLQSGLSTRLKVLSKLDITEKRIPQDGRFKVRQNARVSDMRLSTLPTQFGEKVVMRVLGSSEGAPEPEKLGVPRHKLTALLDSIRQPQGMVIATGPTGSGKTTTLYSLLNYKRSSEVNIVTVEDPIEYHLDGATQVQINPKQGLTFAASLRSILRQDPDVILVGEVRDKETAEIAFHAAMTGHLVLTSLHTNNSIATILRLLDLGTDPFVITSSVTAIIAQRLVRVICDQCREFHTVSPRILQKLGWDDPDFAFTRGKGCKACHGTGYRGRVGIYEILHMTPLVREAINARSSEMEIRKAAVQSGLVSLVQAAREKIRLGQTTPEEVLRVIQWVDESESLCPRCGKVLSPDTGKCVNCDSRRLKYCGSCGQQVEIEWRVCPRCSTALTGDTELPPALKWGAVDIAKKDPGTLQ